MTFKIRLPTINNIQNQYCLSISHKVVDASAKPSSGFTTGNNFWLGSEEQCKYVSHKIDIRLSDRFSRTTKYEVFNEVAPFEVGFKMIYVKHRSPQQGNFIKNLSFESKTHSIFLHSAQYSIMSENILHLGLCLPSSCENAQVQLLTEKILKKADDESTKELRMNFQAVEVKDLGFSPKFLLNKGLWLFVSCCIFVKLMTQAATRLENPLTSDRNKNNLRKNEEIFSLTQDIVKCFKIEQNKESKKSSISGLR